MNKKDLNTKQVGNLFGVDESTVRRWSLTGKIKCNKSAGGHRKFSFSNIIEFAKKHDIQIDPNFKSKQLDRKKIIKRILNHTLNHEGKSIETIFIQLYLNGVPLEDFMDNYIESVLVQLQKKLDEQEISVAEEHIGRKIISKSLNSFRASIIDNKNKNDKNVLCLNLENDIPDLPIDMIQILLENINYNVHNCGSHTSIKNLKKLLKDNKYEAIFIYMCDRQCCTSTVHDNIKKTNEDLSAISILAQKYNIKLFLGGPSFKNIETDTLKHYNLFNKYSDTLAINKY